MKHFIPALFVGLVSGTFYLVVIDFICMDLPAKKACYQYNIGWEIRRRL